MWRRCSLFLGTYLLPPPLHFAEGKEGEVMRSNIPPMLAASRSERDLFLPGPCRAFIKYSIN
jgi:hypothetical protein